MRDGTVISMFENDGGRVTRPILHQILEDNTLTRDCQVRMDLALLLLHVRLNLWLFRALHFDQLPTISSKLDMIHT